MRCWVMLKLVLAITLLTGHALACGGGFGQGLTIRPSQTIVVAYRDGVETYIFGPHFCGAATEFGLILPVPATLTQDPGLGSAALSTELEAISAPAVVTQEVCIDSDDDDNGGAPGTGSATPS